jgi:hypothetical protein
VGPQLGLNADAHVAVAAFIVASGDPDGVLAAHAAMRFTDLVSLHCEAHLGRHGCALIDGTVYALLPARPSASHRDLVADIARRAQQGLRVPVRAALGCRVAGLRAAAASRQDADLVLRVLAGQPGEPDEPQVAAIEDVRASATLAELGRDLAVTPRLREGAGPAIRRHDAEHGTGYARTLLAYLDANSDVAAAAGRLNVHPNTCRYRLARAQEISGLRLADPRRAAAAVAAAPARRRTRPLARRVPVLAVDGDGQQKDCCDDETDRPQPAAQAGLPVASDPVVRGLDVTVRGMGAIGVPAHDAAHNEND